MSGVQLALQAMYRAAQNPAGWLLSAERLHEAAEATLKAEVAKEFP